MITLDGVSVRFGAYTQIDYKQLLFESGQSVAILGGSGCGKSTLLNLISGIISPLCGDITVDGTVISSLSQAQKDAFRIRNIGFIFQDFKLLEKMSVEDNLNVLSLEGVNVKDSGQILAKLGIAHKLKARASTLSGGEKQRVAIARALVKHPSIVLADEPTGNLNYAIGEQVIIQLLDACKGKTLLCVTHDERLCPMFDRVLRLEEYASIKEANIHA
ncbi:MAG: ATP-binding cassette domain-containing protein [Clostridiales bacterium]|nr:ATP-binding cassette domain-containing protein [Clostridiales bacterium]